MQESKEKISARMIKNASRIWGFQDTQSESSFDPFVGMILGALASELAKISNDINTIESRVLEKLVELLTPDPITGPFPAHALIRAKSVDPVFTISSNYQFFTNKKIVAAHDRSDDEKPVFFTPAGNYKLFNGQIKYLVSGSKFFEFQEEAYKEVIAMARPNKSLKTSEVWMALEIDENLESLEGLSICFDLRNEVYERSFYESLNKGKWTINSQPVNFIQGLENEDNLKLNGLDALLQKELDTTTKVCNHINRYYQKKFQTVTGKNLLPPKLLKNSELPNSFYDVFLQKDIENIENNLLWIKVELPQIMPPDVLEDLFCSINCFPVFNRHLTEFTQSSREFINIIPLVTDEVFFDMKKVTSSNGKSFALKAFTGINEVKNGTYIIRHGGVGRFDSRNAAEIVSYLLELLRDESAAFSIIGADMISSDLKELNQTITRLEQRLDHSNVVKKDISYLLLKTHPDDETLFIEFWTTNGGFANKIKSGRKLFAYDGSDLWSDSLITVTTTVGGRESLNAEERVNAYRKALLSHGRVVTTEDIKALCFEHFGKLLKSVEIKKGLQTGKSTNSGFIQTLDIFIILTKSNEDLDKDELLFLKKDLLVKLEEQSSSVLPFRCFINGKE
jgi:hypothetical protein